jgi:ribosome-associated toxin RatA of RatAB toxin-antitoxin module
MNCDSLSTLDETLQTEDVLLTVSKLAGRQRRIEATIHLAHPVERVWQVLTDYEKLADFIPNLSKSSRIPHPDGGIRLEQIGVQNLRIVTFSARVVLDMAEEFQSAIRFHMVEGDFKAFSGAWLLQPMPANESGGTRLTYCLEVWPKPAIPVIAIEQRLRKDLPANLKAIRNHLDRQAALVAQP